MKTIALGATIAASLAATAAFAQNQPVAAGRLPDPLAAPQATAQQPAAPQAAQAQPAQQQAQPPRQPVLPTRHGAAVNGVCTYNLTRALDESAAGQSIRTQAQTLMSQIDTEENGTDLAQQLQQYEGQPVANLPEELRTRAAIYERRRELLSGQVGEHRRALAAELQLGGALAEAYEARNCSILLEDGQITFSRPSYDITDTLLQRANVKVPQWMQLSAIPRLQVQQPQQPAAAPAQPANRNGARPRN